MQIARLTETSFSIKFPVRHHSILGVGVPTTFGTSRTTERTKLARRPRQRNRETIPLSEKKGGQLAVTRRTCLDQLPEAAAAVRCIASLHRAALLARFDGITFINAHDSPANLPQRAANCKVPFIRLFFEENY